MDVLVEEQRRAFAWWLRTGRLPTVRADDGTELKFNLYHDPLNGRFTFAPGGRARALERASGASSDQSGRVARRQTGYVAGGADEVTVGIKPAPLAAPAKLNAPQAPLAAGPRVPRFGRGGNARAFEDPMTLEHAFPELRHAPGGAIVAVADNLLDLTGPADAAQIAIVDNHAQAIFNEIKAIEPKWHFDELGPSTTVQGRINRLDDFRWHRAATYLMMKGETGPVQVETLRFVQDSADRAYERGTKLQRAGRLRARLSDQEALGNYIDRKVRIDLREHYGRYGINAAGTGPVRVNRRENDSSGSDLTFRRPDARVGDVAYDVTLTRKTLKTQQVRGFFNTDFRPSRVVIVRPRQLGADSSYIIMRSEAKR